MTVSVSDLGIHLGVIESGGTIDATMTTRLTLALNAAVAEVEEYVGDATVVDAIKDLATIRLANYYFDETPSRRNFNRNPLRASGAQAVLVRHRDYNLGEDVILSDQALLDQGFTQSEIDILKRLARDSDGFIQLES